MVVANRVNNTKVGEIILKLFSKVKDDFSLTFTLYGA